MRWGIAMGLLLGFGCGEQPRLIVDARTDLQPGVELSILRVELDDGREDSTEVRIGDDWLAGRRVADFRVPSGLYSLRMFGLDATGREVIVRDARVSVTTDTALTLLLTRDCRGVLCDSADAGACFAGQCVSDECSDENPDACGDAECDDASDCPGASACGEVRCDSGACIYAATDVCAADQYCDPEFGCRGTNEGTTEGLIAHYRVDDDPSDGIVDDSSGFERHGTCTECPAFRSGGPRAGYYESSEDDHQVLIESDDTINNLSAFTVACWIRIPPTMRSSRAFFAKPFGPSTANAFELAMTDEVPRFETQSTDGGNTLRAMGPVTPGEWTHITGTFDGTTKRFYVDGVLQDMQDIMPVVWDARPMSLYADINNDRVATPFHAAADDFRLYDRALSDAEIAELATR